MDPAVDGEAVNGAPTPATLSEAACAVLAAGDPADKLRLSAATAAAWRDGRIDAIGAARPPDRPARPDRPVLLAPRDMPKRKSGQSAAHRIALLHALAHIELNAVDLAWDIVAGGAPPPQPTAVSDHRGTGGAPAALP